MPGGQHTAAPFLYQCRAVLGVPFLSRHELQGVVSFGVPKTEKVHALWLWQISQHCCRVRLAPTLPRTSGPKSVSITQLQLACGRR